MKKSNEDIITAQDQFVIGNSQPKNGQVLGLNNSKDKKLNISTRQLNSSISNPQKELLDQNQGNNLQSSFDNQLNLDQDIIFNQDPDNLKAKQYSQLEQDTLSINQANFNQLMRNNGAIENASTINLDSPLISYQNGQFSEQQLSYQMEQMQINNGNNSNPQNLMDLKKFIRSSLAHKKDFKWNTFHVADQNNNEANYQSIPFQLNQQLQPNNSQDFEIIINKTILDQDERYQQQMNPNFQQILFKNNNENGDNSVGNQNEDNSNKATGLNSQQSPENSFMMYTESMNQIRNQRKRLCKTQIEQPNIYHDVNNMQYLNQYIQKLNPKLEIFDNAPFSNKSFPAQMFQNNLPPQQQGQFPNFYPMNPDQNQQYQMQYSYQNMGGYFQGNQGFQQQQPNNGIYYQQKYPGYSSFSQYAQQQQMNQQMNQPVIQQVSQPVTQPKLMQPQSDTYQQQFPQQKIQQQQPQAYSILQNKNILEQFQNSINKIQINDYNQIQINNNQLNILNCCADINYYKIIIDFFEIAENQEKEKIFNIISNNLIFLCKDPYGYQVLLKMIQNGTQLIIKQIFQQVMTEALELTLHSNGCRIIQQLLIQINDKQKLLLLVEKLKNKIVKCSLDQNGNHVIQRVLEIFSLDQIQFIKDEVLSQINILSIHIYGCRIIQKILDYSQRDQIELFIQRLVQNLNQLCQSQYGNYIIQNILKIEDNFQEKQIIYQYILDNFIVLAKNKFASNAIEKSIIYSDQKFLQQLVTLVASQISDIIQIIKDPFGNYVIQRLFEYCTEQQKQIIFTQINQPYFLMEIYKSNYGKHVIAFIEKSFNKKFQHVF